MAVPSGSTTATFTIETTTVALSQDVQITARYQNVAINQILRVTIPPPIARFTFNGTHRGEDKCTLIDNNGDSDCTVDASASSGVMGSYTYLIEIGSHPKVNFAYGVPVAHLLIPNGCDIFRNQSAWLNDDNGAKYLNAVVSLQLLDREGTYSEITTRIVRFYVAGYCGY